MYQSDYFELQLNQLKDRVLITQMVKHPIVNTKDLPSTLHVLNTKVPSIFTNKCFNDKKYSFKKEVSATEVGHLFEHLIIEFLKIELHKKYGTGVVNGITNWDWHKEPVGKFNIEIDSKSEYEKFFKKSVKKAINIIEEIYKDSESVKINN